MKIKNVIRLSQVVVFVFCGVVFYGATNIPQVNATGEKQGDVAQLYLVKGQTDLSNRITRPSISDNFIEMSESFSRAHPWARATTDDYLSQITEEHSYANGIDGKVIFKNDVITNYQSIDDHESKITKEKLTRKGTNFYHDKTTVIDETDYKPPHQPVIGAYHEFGKTSAEKSFGGQDYKVSISRNETLMFIAFFMKSDPDSKKNHFLRLPVTIWELAYQFDEEKSQFFLEEKSKLPCSEMTVLNMTAQTDKDGSCFFVIPLSKGSRGDDTGISADSFYKAFINLGDSGSSHKFYHYEIGNLSLLTDASQKPKVPTETPKETPKFPIPQPKAPLPPIPTSLLNKLTFGTRSTEVKSLQNQLINSGYLKTGDDTGYYGPLTLSAINRYRASLATTAKKFDSSAIIPETTPIVTPLVTPTTTYSPRPTITPSRTPTYTPTPTYSSTPTYSPVPVVTSTPTPTTYIAPVSTPTTSPTPTTTASPTTTSTPSPTYSPNYNYPTSTYSPTPTSSPRPTSTPVSSVFGEYQTASVWSLMLKFLRFTF